MSTEAAADTHPQLDEAPDHVITKPTETDNFQQAVAAWRNLGLTQLIPKLDAAAADLVEHQRDSLVQRKDLAQKTKDFRKLEDGTKLVEIKTLLKSYQTFIDVLSNHAKTVSSAFLSAYTPLSEAPDPYPLLEASIDSVVTAQETVPKLNSENERLRKENVKLQSQLEETEKQLETERGARQSTNDSQATKITEVEQSWTAVLAEKQGNWESREKMLEDKIQNQDRLLRELKASYEVSQRLDKAEGDDGHNSILTASAAELDIANSELEKANLRLSELEGRNEQMRIELAQVTSKNGLSHANTSIQDEPAFLRLRSENTSLLRKLDSVRYEKDSEQGKLDMKMRGLEREIASLSDDCVALREKVKKWSDYDDMKQELDMIKAIEFSTGDDAGDTLSSPTTAGSTEVEPLERLLLTRNKQLGNQVTELRMSQKDLQAQQEELQANLEKSNTELEKTRSLNATLENDLLRAQQHVQGNFDTSAMSVAGTYTSRMPKSSHGGRRGGTSPTSSIISGFDGSVHHNSSSRGLEGLRGAGDSAAAGGILPMVTAQRDRFKKKIGELETELQKSYQTVSSLRSEIASLQRDNLQLYEKTRYVSTYARPATTATAAGSTSSFSERPNPGLMAADPATSMDRYRSAYESKISPFAAFRGRESARAFKRMTLPERVVYQITRIVLATRTSRNLFALYCLGLHVLVVLMLYWMGTGDIERQATNLGQAVDGVKASEQWQPAGFQ